MPSKQDLRVMRTKKAIKDALVALLQKKAFESITIQDISDQAMINRSTFYAHYIDKYDLLEQYSQELLTELRTVVSPDRPDRYELSGAVQDSVKALFTHVAENDTFYKAMFYEFPEFRWKMENSIRDGMRDRMVVLKGKYTYKYISNIDENLMDDLFFQYYTNAAMGVMNWWIKNDMIYSPEHMSNIFAELSTKGMHDLYGFKKEN